MLSDFLSKVFFVLGSQRTSGARTVTRKYLFDRMQSFNLPNLEEKLTFLNEELLSCGAYSEEQIKTFKSTFSHFKSQLRQRWSKAHKKEDVFRKYNDSWLEGTIEIPAVAQNWPGRPRKLFGDSSERTKRRKTEEIRSNVEEDVIVHAAQIELRKSGKRNASDILKEITSTSPTRATKYKRAFSETRKEETCPLTPLQALAMFVEADLTRRQYEIIRNTNKKFFPCPSKNVTHRQRHAK